MEKLGKFLINSFFQINRKIAGLKIYPIKVNDINSYYLDNNCTNPETPIVFIHGFGDNLDSFARTAAYFRNRRNIHLDLPGFSISDCPDDFPYTLKAYGRWVKNLLDALGLNKCHLVGNSLGGGITLQVAIDYPDMVESITLLDTAGVLPEKEQCIYHRVVEGKNPFTFKNQEDFVAFRKQIIRRKIPVPKSVDVYLGRDFSRRNEWFQQVMSKLTFGAKSLELTPEMQSALHNEKLKSVKAPALIIWGDKDVLFPVEVGEILRRELPKSKLAIYKGVGHCPQHEYPKRVANEIKNFWSEFL